ncbi:MAG: glycosyltransferase family 2 protein [Brevinematales bacterium]
MKFCILSAGQARTVNDMPLAGFYQWANAFHGEIFYKNISSSPDKNISFRDYDIILIRLLEENFSLIDMVREGKNKDAKLVVCCDIPVKYWKHFYKKEGDLSKAVLKSDMAFSTEYSISRRLSSITGKKVYEIPHPADIEKISGFKTMVKENIMTVIYNKRRDNTQDLQHLSRITGLKPVFVEYDSTFGDDFQQDKVSFSNESEFSRLIAKSRLVVSAGCPDYGRLLVYAAAMGLLVIGDGAADSQRRCYLYTCVKKTVAREIIPLYNWLSSDQEAMKFILDVAYSKVQYYNWDNVKNRFLQILSAETGEKKFQESLQNQIERGLQVNFCRDIRLVYGPRDPNIKDFAVISLVKNGSPHIDAFIRHYKALGAGHFFIIDNGSDDNTVEMLKKFDNITLYSTLLPHKLFECEIRRFVIESHCRNKWCIYADIDEFFDFPFSVKIGMKGLISYLSENNYTALVSYMLDMFSIEKFHPENPGYQESFENKYSYYDISDVKKADYFRYSRFLCGYNIIPDRKIKFYYGGIRNRVFKGGKNKYLLIKHPLVYIDSFIEVLTNPHFCNKAKIADITGVLKHYKYVPSFKDKVSVSLTSDSDYDYFTKKEYKAYQDRLKDKKSLNFYTRSSKKLINTDQLLKDGFIRSSKKYENFIKTFRG